MKKAISYKRVAVDTLRSSHNSIYHQELAIQVYCRNNEINILQSFEEVGSGSTIDHRPEWKALEAFLQQHNGNIDLLIVTNLDRISRNFFLLQEKLLELQTKYGIEIVTTRATTHNEIKLFEEVGIAQSGITGIKRRTRK